MAYKIPKRKSKKEIKEEEKFAKWIVNSEAFKGLIKAGFTERKAFKIMRGY
jgi:hypothetical protein